MGKNPRKPNLSIKLKITLWYTLLMALLGFLFLFLLLTVSNMRVLSSTGSRLQNTVIRSFREISFPQGSLSFDDDFTNLGIEEGIYLSAYDLSGNFLYGRLPAYYNGTPELVMDELQQDYDFYTHWYLYDSLMEIDGYGSLWVRGITSQTAAERMMFTLVRISMIILPFFLFMISLGGYLIIRRALSPLDQATATAYAISQGNDLSRRIGLKKGNDEVHHLSYTFDYMVEQLESAFEREKRFTSDVSHELRTPITVILSQCEYALSQSLSSSEQQTCLQSIQNQAKKMSRLITQLLTLARADSGRLLLTKEEINLSQLLEIICEEQQELALAKGIQLETAITPDLHLFCDETMMIRLFINLFNNAITYGKKNGHIFVSLHLDEGEIEGSIRDDGIGIAPNHLPHIWERFYQVDDSRTSSNRNSHNSGLGLPMVKWIVEAHGGRISVESTLNKGTAFLFRFPLQSS